MSSVEESPSKRWRNPSQVMKVRMKRQRKSTSDLNSQPSLSNQLRTNPRLGDRLVASGSGRSGKRRNPFGNAGGNVMRRRVQSEVVDPERLEKENGDKVQHQKLFTALDSQKDEVFNEEACQRLAATIKSMEEEQEQEEPQTKEQGGLSSVPLQCGQPTLTADWCLRTRLRFTSRSSFGWCQPMRMMEEAKGLCSFVQGGRDSEMEEQETVKESMWRSQLQQSTMCWMHPNLPWLSLFPRIVPEPKTFKTSITTKDPALASSLMASWSESFRSVFHLLRSGHCPYFYLCTHLVTVLFRGAGVAGMPTIHALMSPTTRGLREALKTEGISFSMPLHEDAPLQAETSKTASITEDGSSLNHDPMTRSPKGEAETEIVANQEVGVVRDDNADDEDADADEDILRSPTKASSWLQSMGLDRAKFPSLAPSRVKFQTDHLLKLDNRPQSLVLVEGSDTQALYNFLLNSRTVLTTVGPLADIPPTILSPMAFKGATLNCCKIKSGTMKQQSRGSSLEEVGSLEVTGPIMPHNIHDLCTLLRSSQEDAFHMVLSNHEATAPFTASTHTLNEKSAAKDASMSEERLMKMKVNCGLSESLSRYLTGNCKVNASVKELTRKDGFYYL